MSLPPRPHPLARSPHVERVCGWLEKSWARGITSRPSLDVDVLWGKALRDVPAEGERGPRSEADMADFRLRLEVLAESLQREAKLNALGLTMAHGQLVRVIRQRLELGELWSQQPDLIETELAPPIIIVGQMRSGTTRVHRLLAADPILAATRFCDSWHPVPRKPDTRPAWSALTLLFARTLDPWLDSIHPFGTTRPDEELGWLACALDHCAYEAQWRVPSFTAFSEDRDPAAIYREFGRILRTDACWHENTHRPRVLKVPQFTEDLPAILAEFPDARVIVTRRDQDDLVSSSASLVANQMTIQSDAVDMDWIEGEVTRKIALRDARMEAALADFDGPHAVVDFDALNVDWETEVARVYRHLEMPLSGASLEAMRDEQARAASSPHRHHAQQRESFRSKPS
ncbi:sulfotransferase family protein [Aurantiacibacter sp. D1-12]|uniref:sulfotransferase family protein n=1 Tax=Aurantiacibacter sp. D1-12 TaxID=2993658 RepID=UPI00237CC708|nr:sulfotransferase [Aurantiacibacter sp. D1-12]MDE1466227.1 sulfotransferase [Aurantiacibacter sp. D1-12]